MHSRHCKRAESRGQQGLQSCFQRKLDVTGQYDLQAAVWPATGPKERSSALEACARRTKATIQQHTNA